MKKVFYFVTIIVCIFIIVFFRINQKPQVVTKNLFYMDTYINIKIYTNKRNIDNIFFEIEKTYQEYHQLTDRYNSYDDLINIYYINNNVSEELNLTLDERLYKIIKYSLEWKEKSKGLFNIELGNVIDCWKKQIELETGIPSQSELDGAFKSLKEVELLDNNQIVNNHPNLDLGGIAKGYVTDIVGQYLTLQGYHKYIINAGGHVLVGERAKNDKYKIGIKNPVNDEILTVVKGEKISVATSGGSERFYEYKGKRYNHIINPNNLYPGDYMLSVSVISNDSKLNDILTTTLFLMSVEEGLEMIDNMDGVEAIWVTNDEKIIKSKGFNNYE